VPPCSFIDIVYKAKSLIYFFASTESNLNSCIVNKTNIVGT
jgi:hypothetical protein